MKSRRINAVLGAVSLSVILSCEGAGIPWPVTGQYALVTVDGQPLPVQLTPSVGLGFFAHRGDLLLRSDNSFTHGMRGSALPGVIHGMYRRAGGDVTLEWQFPGFEPQELTGNVFRDSIVLFLRDAFSTRRFSYHRVRGESGQALAGLFELTKANGRTGQPVVLHDTVINGYRYVSSAIDSLTFTENVFVRRHRFEQTVSTDPQGNTTAFAEDWISEGAFDREAGRLLVEYYWQPPAAGFRAVDTLEVVGDTLVRRTATVLGMQEERYTRR